ncbi:MAG: patatin-like phospholipase family protein [Chlorobiaceae bacterium]
MPGRLVSFRCAFRIFDLIIIFKLWSRYVFHQLKELAPSDFIARMFTLSDTAVFELLAVVPVSTIVQKKENAMKKILSIDGGGIRGIIPALVLAEIEKKTGRPAAMDFDLIAGTSTGGIIALGLSRSSDAGAPLYSAADLAGMYEKRREEIFPRSLLKDIATLDGVMDERYSAEGLESILEEYFGEEPIGAGLVRTLLTCYDIQNREPLFIKSWRKEHHSVLMKHAARATSAAPTYFEPALVPIGGAVKALIDGGVFINSPAVSAYAEAKILFPDESDFFLLSLGTGELIRPINYNEAKGWGKAGWAVPVMSCMFDGMSDASNYQMEIFLGERYVRLQITLSVASDDMDCVSRENIENLKGEASRLISRYEKEIDEVCHLLSS